MSSPPLLEMTGVSKDFSGVPVLHDVDFTLHAGEVHALVGENGAGKTTLIKILAGVHTYYQGTIRLGDRPVRFRGPQDAQAAGIAVIYQELALVPYLSAAENIALGREPRRWWGGLNRSQMRREATDVLRDQLGIEIDVDRPVADLPLAAQQLVEIAKALARRAAVLVMDEPTSALSETEAQRLFLAIHRLRSNGAGVIYISHRMEELYALADRITVLRDGRHVGTGIVADLPQDRLVQWMVGRTIDQFYPRRGTRAGPPRLRVRNLSLRLPGTRRWLLHDVSLEVRAGEVVGLAGLIGSGTSELLGGIFGRYGRPDGGEVSVDGEPLASFSPQTSIERGVALLTNDRKASGLVLSMSVLQNMSLSVLRRCRTGGLLDRRRERQSCTDYAERLKLRAPSFGAPVTALSGGNQQKVLFARWLLIQPRVLLLDEPTRGIDVGAKADIYALLDELSAAGLAILLITSELPELLALADRIVVLHRGRMTGELCRAEATPELVMRAAMGEQSEPAGASPAK